MESKKDVYLGTEYVGGRIGQCENEEEFMEEVHRNLHNQQELWVSKINEIITKSNCSYRSFAGLCGVSPAMVLKWMKGSIPSSKEQFMIIGMVAGYDENEMNLFLSRYGRFPMLYVKCLEDCICQYVINNYEGAAIRIEKYKYIIGKIDNLIFSSQENEDIETAIIDRKLREVKNDDDLEAFIAANANAMTTAYNKLYCFVIGWIHDILFGKDYIHKKEKYVMGISSSFADPYDWSSSLRHTVSAINQKKWKPTRDKLISLGLHLGMTHEDMDEMLSKAHMGPLYSKNVFESIIIFILEYTDLNFEAFDDSNSSENRDFEIYIKELYLNAQRILRKFSEKLPQAEAFLNEFKGELHDEENEGE